MKYWTVAIVLILAGCSGNSTATSTTVSTTTTTQAVVTTSTTSTTSLATTTTVPEPETIGNVWTVILASVDATTHTKEQAETVAEGFGDKVTGVLLSDDYPNLNPGFWVIYSQTFDEEQQAKEHCAALQNDNTDCYHRFLESSDFVTPTYANGRALAWQESNLVIMDMTDGSVIDTIIAEFWGGVFPGEPQLAPDGRSAFFDVGYEDFWYSCETSTGAINQVDLISKQMHEVAKGFYPTVSGDGQWLAYATVGNCIPDPAEPDVWVLAFHDTIVIRDLATGEEERWETSDQLATSDESQILGIVWDNDGVIFLLTDGTLRRISPEDQGGVDSAQIVATVTIDDQTLWYLLGVHPASGKLFAIRSLWEIDHSTVVAIDLASGTAEDVGEYDDSIFAGFDNISGEMLIGTGHSLDHVVYSLTDLPYISGIDW